MKRRERDYYKAVVQMAEQHRVVIPRNQQILFCTHHRPFRGSQAIRFRKGDNTRPTDCGICQYCWRSIFWDGSGLWIEES